MRGALRFSSLGPGQEKEDGTRVSLSRSCQLLPPSVPRHSAHDFSGSQSISGKDRADQRGVLRMTNMAPTGGLEGMGGG